jgi:hypothetical protein
MVFCECCDERSAYFGGTCLVIVLGTSQEEFSKKVPGISQEGF